MTVVADGKDEEEAADGIEKLFGGCEIDGVKKLLFIYNPNAGTGVLKPKLSDVLDIFVKAGYEVTVYPTQCYHDASKKAGSLYGNV